MKTIFRITVLVLMMHQMYAQQLPQYTQYMLNDMAINPAVTGKMILLM